nr:MFS transporter [Rhizobium sp. ACO-34A]
MAATENAGNIATDETGSITESRTRLLVLLGLLYFTQGLPIGLSMEALPVLMRQSGASMDMIALVPLAGLPWILKLFWAPMVDNHWSEAIGRRKSWILPMQAIVMASLAALAFMPLHDTGLWFAFAILVAGSLASATQDTASDGLAAEQLRGAGLAHANALQVGGLMAGFMVGGGGVLMVADMLGQAGTFLVLAVFPLLSLLVGANWREPSSIAVARQARLKETFRRRGIYLLLLMAFVYGGAHAGGLSVTKVFLVDAGWSNYETGTIATLSGLVLVLAGCPLGSVMTARNRWLTMAVGIFLAAVSFVLWGLIAWGAMTIGWLSVAVALGILSVASGLIAVSAATIIMAFGGSGQQAGTDVTVLQSANITGEMVIAGLVVWAAGRFGYAETFGAAALLLVLAILFVVLAARSFSNKH